MEIPFRFELAAQTDVERYRYQATSGGSGSIGKTGAVFKENTSELLNFQAAS
ncbi:MAG: hypothetical protein HY788_16060 [Deltaproteobacteria bacterium]|nr:hypothetical protein [Deltaproteobacteria bacterium]